MKPFSHDTLIETADRYMARAMKNLADAVEHVKEASAMVQTAHGHAGSNALADSSLQQNEAGKDGRHPFMQQLQEHVQEQAPVAVDEIAAPSLPEADMVAEPIKIAPAAEKPAKKKRGRPRKQPAA